MEYDIQEPKRAIRHRKASKQMTKIRIRTIIAQAVNDAWDKYELYGNEFENTTFGKEFDAWYDASVVALDKLDIEP